MWKCDHTCSVEVEVAPHGEVFPDNSMFGRDVNVKLPQGIALCRRPNRPIDQHVHHRSHGHKPGAMRIWDQLRPIQRFNWVCASKRGSFQATFGAEHKRGAIYTGGNRLTECGEHAERVKNIGLHRSSINRVIVRARKPEKIMRQYESCRCTVESKCQTLVIQLLGVWDPPYNK